MAAVSVAGTLAVTGCQVLSPQQTMKPYQPAEGISVTLGDIEIRNLLVVSSAKDAPGVLSGFVLNKSASPISLSIGVGEGTPVTADVDARSTTRLSGGDGVSVAPLATVASAPGGLVQLNISTPSGGTEQVQVPVVLPNEYFSTLTPSAAPTPALTPTDIATETPGATATPSAT